MKRPPEPKPPKAKNRTIEHRPGRASRASIPAIPEPRGVQAGHAPDAEEQGLPDDVMTPVRDFIERQALRSGGISLKTAERLMVRVLERLGVEVQTGTKVSADMAARAVDALCGEGRLRRLTAQRFAPVLWSDVLEHPDYQLSSRGLVRNRATGRVLRTREDPRGRTLVDLGGTTYDVDRLTPLTSADRDVAA